MIRLGALNLDWLTATLPIGHSGGCWVNKIQERVTFYVPAIWRDFYTVHRITIELLRAGTLQCLGGFSPIVCLGIILGMLGWQLRLLAFWWGALLVGRKRVLGARIKATSYRRSETAVRLRSRTDQMMGLGGSTRQNPSAFNAILGSN